MSHSFWVSASPNIIAERQLFFAKARRNEGGRATPPPVVVAVAAPPPSSWRRTLNSLSADASNNAGTRVNLICKSPISSHSNPERTMASRKSHEAMYSSRSSFATRLTALPAGRSSR